jgi:hypothetical protein
MADGLRPRCKTCEAVASKYYRELKRKRPNTPLGTHRTCTGCGERKPLDQFGPNPMGAHGRTAQCRACYNIRNRRNAEIHKQYGISILRTEKRCPVCGETKPAEQYNKARRRPDGLTDRCRSCIAVSNKEYYRRKRDQQSKAVGDCV